MSFSLLSAVCALLTFAALSGLGCSRPPAPPDSFTEPEFSEYVLEFAEAWGGRMPELTVRFHAGLSAAAECDRQGGLAAVRVNPEVWVGLCPAQRRALLWHELGHCVLLREHVAEATSYMYGGALLPCEHYDRNRSSLDAEFFTPEG